MSNNRNVFLDILKGLLIISVVLGHSIQYGSGELFLQSGAYWEHPLMRLIYSVHMPLFMGISGYLSCFTFVVMGIGCTVFLFNKYNYILHFGQNSSCEVMENVPTCAAYKKRSNGRFR